MSCDFCFALPTGTNNGGRHSHDADSCALRTAILEDKCYNCSVALGACRCGGWTVQSAMLLASLKWSLIPEATGG